jgi:hypothetical protein
MWKCTSFQILFLSTCHVLGYTLFSKIGKVLTERKFPSRMEMANVKISAYLTLKLLGDNKICSECFSVT